jgi:hypothetical protein
MMEYLANKNVTIHDDLKKDKHFPPGEKASTPIVAMISNTINPTEKYGHTDSIAYMMNTSSSSKGELGSTCIPVVKRIAFQSHAHSDSNALE